VVRGGHKLGESDSEQQSSGEAGAVQGCSWDRC
jgi:hypothetical protein